MHQLVALTLLVIFWSPLETCGKSEGFRSCVPKNIDLKSVIREEQVNSAGSKTKEKSLEEHLSKLHARCTKGKLVDLNGKEIRIVQLIGCWGNPPEDYQEQLDRQQEELKRLREKYTVIEIPCRRDKVIAE